MKNQQIAICLGSSCYRRGNRKTLDIVKNWLKENGLEESTVFKGELCSGNCAHGPNLKINGEIIHIDENSVIHVLEKYFM